MAQKSISEQSIFLEALEKSSADARASYLDEVCGDDRQLRADVDSLLMAHGRLPGLKPAGTSAHEPATLGEQPISEGPGTVIGAYKLLEQIGEGGFGLVFMAEQRQPIRRKVALKILKPGMDTRQVVARFEAERQALALMDHPNIAGVFDGGETAGGRPYFVMELVKGMPIVEHCDQNRLTPRERLELFIQVCHGVQHAHQKGIIHRDIKPSNILITLHDGTPVAKVIDFGIAKATGSQLTEKTLFTNFAQLIGTPEYMSPEQAGQSGLDVDTRSDIYSLGVLLYELLTGRTPLGRKRFKEADYDEIRRLVREEEAPKPSTRVSTLGEAGSKVAAQRKSDPKQLSKLFKGELDWIAMKALEKDRTRRYDTASAMAADVQRYLNDEPVQACPPSAWYKFRKFTRRNKGALAIAASVALVLTMVAGGVGWTLQERAGRVSRTASEIDLVLEQVEHLKKDKNWTEALAAVNRAEGLLAGGEGSVESQKRLREARAAVERRLRQARADQKMLVELAEIPLKQAEVKVDRFDSFRADDDYEDAFREYGIDVDKLKVDEAANRVQRQEIAPELVAALDNWTEVRRLRKPKQAGWRHLLAVAKAGDPNALRNQVRAALASGDRKTLEQLANAANVAELPPSTLVLLGKALTRSGSDKEAVVFLQRAQVEYPGDFWINHHLAFTLTHLNPPQHAKAISYYMAALAIRKSPGVYVNFALSLRQTGALDEAIAANRQAIRLKPDYAMAHNNLGGALIGKGRLDEAHVAILEAIRLQPELGSAYTNLGLTLKKEKGLDAAITAFEDAIRLKPNSAVAHYQLGYVLTERRRFDEAIVALREAVRIKPDFDQAHRSLGQALRRKGLVDEAIAAYDEAIRLAPNNTGYQGDLGLALHRKGQFQEALAAFDRGTSTDLPYTILLDYRSYMILDCQRLIAVEDKLPAILKGDILPSDAATLMALARYCHYNDKYAAAVGFYQKAFEAQPQLAGDQDRWNRVNAASAAAFASCDKNEHADGLDATERSRLRRQAFVWLRADLEQCQKRFTTETKRDWAVLFRHLEPWQLDFSFPDFRGAALAAMPITERREWQQLWDDMEAFRQRMQKDA